MDKLEKLNQLEETARQEEEQELFYDFDKAIEEKTKQPLSIQFKGKVFEVPNEMPIDFSMFFFRHCLKKKNGKEEFEVPESKMIEFVTLMFGEEFLKDLEKTKTSVTLIFYDLCLKILSQWGYNIKTEAKKQTVQKKI